MTTKIHLWIRFSVIVFCLGLTVTLAQQVEDVIPGSSLLNLSHSSQRRNGYYQDVGLSGLFKLAGTPNLSVGSTTSSTVGASIGGRLNVTDGTLTGTAGAKCDGKTDDTEAIQAAIDYAAYHDMVVYIPAGLGYTACRVSQLNATNLVSAFRMVGESAETSFQSVIKCQESSNNTGVCLDLTGSQQADLSNIQFLYGSNPPKAVIRMGKSTGGLHPDSYGTLPQSSNGNGEGISTDHLYIVGGGSYAVFNNGGEVWSSWKDHFGGGSVAALAFSSNRAPDVTSSWVSIPPTNESMSNVTLVADTIASSAPQTILFDYGTGGTVEDVTIVGGYGQATAGHPLIADRGKGELRHFVMEGFREEPQGSDPYPLISLTNPAVALNVNAMYAAATAPTQPLMKFGSSVTSSFFNVIPGDSPRFYPTTEMTCTGSAQNTFIINYVNGSSDMPISGCGGASVLNSNRLSVPSIEVYGNFRHPPAASFGRGGLFLGWNQTNGSGDSDFINNRYVGSGFSGSFNFYDTTDGTVGSPILTIFPDGSLNQPGVTFANLGTPANGTQTYCSNCTVTTPASCANVTTTAACTCTPGGAGAIAKRINGAWLCN